VGKGVVMSVRYIKPDKPIILIPDSGVGSLDANKIYGYLLHDYQVGSWWGVDKINKTRWYPKTYGNPETVATFLKEDRVSLSPAWQDFHKLMFTLAAFGEAKLSLFSEISQAFDSVMSPTRVITNDKGFPEGYMPLCMGGNIVEIYGLNIERPNAKFGLSYKIKCLDGSKSPPDVEDIFWNHPELWSKATVARYAYSNDDIPLSNPWSHVIPFPQLDKYNAHVPLLNISNTGYNWIPIQRMGLWENNFAPNPYNPKQSKAFE